MMKHKNKVSKDQLTFYDLGSGETFRFVGRKYRDGMCEQKIDNESYNRLFTSDCDVMWRKQYNNEPVIRVRRKVIIAKL